MSNNDVRYRLSLEDKFNSTLKKAEKGVVNFEKKIINAGKVIGTALIGKVLISRITELGNELIKTTAEFEGFENAIAFLSDSASEGAKSMSFLEKNADNLGVSLQASIEGFQTLTGGFRGTGIELETVKDIFKKTSIAASAMNLSGERTKLVLLALGQMASKGVVSMEELRRQLGDSLPGAAGIGARAMGMTIQEFNKMVESGKLLSKDFLPKFANELQNTFGNALGKSTKSLRANLNRLDNSFLKLKVNIGKRLTPAFKSTISLTNKIVKGVSDWAKIPLSQTLEKQRLRLNALIISLNDSTKSEEDRLNILNEIKTISPEIAKSIKKEGDQYKISAKKLREFNTELLNRILIQKKQEEIDKFRAKASALGAKKEEVFLKAQETRANAIFKISEKNKKDGELVQALLDGTVKKETSLSELREKFGEKNAILLNQSGIQQSRNNKDFINAQNIAIREITRRNGLTLEAIGFNEDFYNLIREFNPLFNAQRKAQLDIKNLEAERLKLAKALGVELKTEAGAKAIGIDPDAKKTVDEITKITAASPKIFNITIQKLTGIESVNTTTIKEGASMAGNAVKEELQIALADLQITAR